MLHDLRHRLFAFLFRRRAEADLNDELNSHLQMEADRIRATGMDEATAHRIARQRFGGTEQIREACRDARGTRWLEDFLRDFRHGFRLLARNPVFALTAILSLALGIGANTAVFGVIDALILKPLPFREPGRLVMVWETMPRRGVQHSVVSAGNLLDWRRQSTAFDDMVGIDSAVANLTGVDTPSEIHGQFVPAELFPLLGAQPAIGRAYTAEEARQNARVIVLSDRLARHRFGSPAVAPGKVLELDRQPWQVIGVMPADFEFLDAESDFWRPWYLDPSKDRRNEGRFMRAIARLKPGVTLERAENELRTIAARLEDDYPDFDKGWSVALTSYREEVSGGYRTPLFFLMGAAGLVMLIACVNVANLLVARAGARRRELAIRTSLGAARSRLARQMIAESLLLELLGAIPGIGLAIGSLAVFRRLAPAALHGLAAVGVDARMLGFTALLSLAAVLVFGTGPALLTSRTAAAPAVKEGGRSGGSAGRIHSLAGILVALEFAVAVILVMASGLLLRSLHALRTVETGFVADHVLTARILLPGSYDPSRVKAFFVEAIRRLEALPGVSSASAVTFMPFGGLRPGTEFIIEGRPEPPKGQRPATEVRAVLPGYFRTLGTRLVRGRDFTAQEGSPERPAFVVNESFARTQWPGEDPVGKIMTVRMGLHPMPGVIVGVVADTKDRKLDAGPQATVFYSHSSLPISYMTLVIRAHGDPASLTRGVTGAIHAIDPGQPVMDIQTLDAMLDKSVSPRRFQAVLLAAFAAIALLLAAVGVYGVAAWAVAHRTNEIGIRMALGATRAQILKLISRQSGIALAIGLSVGLMSALLLHRAITPFLFGVTPADPVVLSLSLLLLAAIALLATLGPAVRATRIDPVAAVRMD